MWEREQHSTYDPFEMQQCQDILAGAIKHGLQIEVLIAAFKHKEANPQATLLECLLEGAMEWDL